MRYVRVCVLLLVVCSLALSTASDVSSASQDTSTPHTRSAQHVTAAAQATVQQVEVYKAGMSDSGGPFTCFRIPALVTLRSGRILAFAEGRRTAGCGDHGDVRIVLRVSDDGGSSWGPIQEVVSEQGHTIGNPAPVVDVLSRADEDLVTLLYSRDNHQVFFTRAVDSAAKGTLQWSKPTNITSSVKGNPSPTSWIATGPPGGIQMPAAVGNGRLAICTNYAAPDGHDYAFAIYSDDRGATWNASQHVPLGSATINNECQLAQSSPTAATLTTAAAAGYKVYAFIRGEPKDRSSQSHHYVAASADGGMTWAPSAAATGVHGPECEGSIRGYASPDGWHYQTSAPGSPDGRQNMTVYRVADGGDPTGTWQVWASLWAGPAAYSSQQAISKGVAGVLYERGDTWAYESLYLAMFPSP